MFIKKKPNNTVINFALSTDTRVTTVPSKYASTNGYICPFRLAIGLYDLSQLAIDPASAPAWRGLKRSMQANWVLPLLFGISPQCR